MNIISINSSPHGRHGSTQAMINAMLKGLESPENEISSVILLEKNIEHCRGCYTCWFKTPGVCIINDDMKELIGMLSNADLIILGTPMYYINISGRMKVFFDRLLATSGHLHPELGTSKENKIPNVIMMSSCGLTDRDQFEVISLWINKITKLLKINLIGEFYTTHGRTLIQPTDEQTNARDNYVKFLEDCGRQYRDNKELTLDQKTFTGRNILEF
jgi:multimeric flavodoxin WrbA